MAMIELEHVNKYYGQGATRFHVLHDINLQVAAGELMAIIGESGSGKSTLINIIGFWMMILKETIFTMTRRSMTIRGRILPSCATSTWGLSFKTLS